MTAIALAIIRDRNHVNRTRLALAWSIAILLFPLRWSCRLRWHDDPRGALRASGTPYVYAILHCHLMSAVLGRERGTAAMVSRSGDGEMLIPSLRAHGMVPVRGSGRLRGQDKGGASALRQLVEHVRNGAPAYLAVDGPRGPRNQVNEGIANLSLATGAAVLVAVPVPRRRWILSRSWDRFQIPKPFTRVDVFFGPPLRPEADEDAGAFCRRIEKAIRSLEERSDPEEASLCRSAAEMRALRRHDAV